MLNIFAHWPPKPLLGIFEAGALILRFRRCLLAVWLLLACSAALALDAPEFDITTTQAGLVRIEFRNAQDITGFNVYKDTNYLLTVPRVSENGFFERDAGRGSYCIVAYAKTLQGTHYSSCSQNTVAGSDAPAEGYLETGLTQDLQTVAPDVVEPEDGLSAPANLTVRVYSKTSAELFWAPLSPGQTVLEHRIYRDGELIGSTDGRSFFVNRLSAGQRYVFTIKRINSFGIASAAAKIELLIQS